MPAKLSEAEATARHTAQASSFAADRHTAPTGADRAASDLPKELREHWQRHMILVIASGRMATVDLTAFREMVGAAHLYDIAYAAAIEEGPCVPGDEGQMKSGGGPTSTPVPLIGHG